MDAAAAYAYGTIKIAADDEMIDELELDSCPDECPLPEGHDGECLIG